MSEKSYHIIISEIPAEVVTDTNRLMMQGWVPLGAPFALYEHDAGTSYYHQAMVRKAELEQEIQPLENADSEENRADLANDAGRARYLDGMPDIDSMSETLEELLFKD
jgi:hypothetical protein